MVKIRTLKEMNSCRNWHCCCHTIIPKKRRQDAFRQFRSPPAKSSKLDVENEKEQISYELTSKVPDSPQFQDNDEIENGEFDEEMSSSQSESDLNENESSQTEIVLNGIDNPTLPTEESSNQYNSGETLALTPKPLESVEKEESESPKMVQLESQETETEGDADEAMPAVEKVEKVTVEEKGEKSANAISEEPQTPEAKTVNVEKSIDEEKKTVKVKTEAAPKVLKETTPKAAVPSPVPVTTATTPKKGEVKDSEQPSTSTGASTGRYNCRNREKFHKCLKCGKMFFQLDSFVRHEKEHLLEETKPCYCTVCNRSYTSMSSFSRHLKTHITCAQCNKIFSQAEVGKLSPGGQNYHCSDCKKTSSPQPPVLQPEGPIKIVEVGKSKQESGNHVTVNNGGTTVYARKSVPVFIEKRKSEPGTPVKKVKLGLQSSHLKVSKINTAFLKCKECDRRFPNLTTLKNHRTLHTVT